MYGVFLFWLYLNDSAEYRSGIQFLFLGRHICDGILEKSLHGLCTLMGTIF